MGNKAKNKEKNVKTKKSSSKRGGSPPSSQRWSQITFQKEFGIFFQVDGRVIIYTWVTFLPVI